MEIIFYSDFNHSLLPSIISTFEANTPHVKGCNFQKILINKKNLTYSKKQLIIPYFLFIFRYVELYLCRCKLVFIGESVIVKIEK